MLANIVHLRSLDYVTLKTGRGYLLFNRRERYYLVSLVPGCWPPFACSSLYLEGHFVLDPIDIVTTASANGDITGALKTLPGAQQVGESEGLFVRGGTATETKTFIDGTLVNNFFMVIVCSVQS